MWINLSIIWISHSEQLRHSFMVSRQWVAIRTKSEVLNIPASASCPKLLAFLLSPAPIQLVNTVPTPDPSHLLFLLLWFSFPAASPRVGFGSNSPLQTGPDGSRICWERPPFWKACSKQNPWECWACAGCSQQRSATDSVRTSGWSGDSRHYCVWDFDTGSWHEMCCGKIHSVASVTRAEGTLCCSC